MKATVFALLVLASPAFLSGDPDSAVAPQPAPETYTIDSAHSSVVFRSKRDVAYFFGRFDRIEGEIRIDAEKPIRARS
jgi:polyisoprenoid-binding protein YceI